MKDFGADSSGSGTLPAQVSRILVVDDEEMIRILLNDILTAEGYEVTTAFDGRWAIDLLERERFDLILTDMVMPGRDGTDVLRAAKRIDPGYPVVVMTGYPSVEAVTRLIRLGAADYITKPFNVDVLTVTVAKLLEMRQVSTVPAGEESSHPG